VRGVRVKTNIGSEVTSLLKIPEISKNSEYQKVYLHAKDPGFEMLSSATSLKAYWAIQEVTTSNYKITNKDTNLGDMNTLAMDTTGNVGLV